MFLPCRTLLPCKHCGRPAPPPRTPAPPSHRLPVRVNVVLGLRRTRPSLAQSAGRTGAALARSRRGTRPQVDPTNRLGRRLHTHVRGPGDPIPAPNGEGTAPSPWPRVLRPLIVGEALVADSIGAAPLRVFESPRTGPRCRGDSDTAPRGVGLGSRESRPRAHAHATGRRANSGSGGGRGGGPSSEGWVEGTQGRRNRGREGRWAREIHREDENDGGDGGRVISEHFVSEEEA